MGSSSHKRFSPWPFSDRFILCRAEFFKIAIDALWFAREADPASMPDQLVGELDPLALWKEFDQVLLDFFWIGIFAEVQAIRKADNVGVHDNAAGNAVA